MNVNGVKKYLSFLLFFSSYGLVYSNTKEAVSPSAYELCNFLGLPITNSMITTWVISLILILVVRFVVGPIPKLIPDKGQLVLESILENIQSVIAPIVGKRMLLPTFPILLSFFVFILIHNWSGLLPGVGTFGIWENGHLLYFFRPANSDLNTTLGLSIVSMIAWVYFVMRYEGLKSFCSHLFGNKANAKEVPFFIYIFLFLIFFLVGGIECISILFRLVSLSFRLYGNMFGGESLLSTIQGIFKYILPVPFYFLEVLIGGIQAFVFTLLIAVYIGLVCNHEDAH